MNACIYHCLILLFHSLCFIDFHSTVDKMSDVQQKAKKNVDTLKADLKNMPVDMRLFTLSMRSLYSTDAVGGQSEAAQKFRKLRDDTRHDGVIYLRCLLPLTMKYVGLLKDYFDYYASLGFDDWKKYLSDVVAHVKASQQVAQFLLENHKTMMTSLKKREDEAKIIMKELKDLEAQYEASAKKLARKGKTEKFWAIPLALIPFVGVIASAVITAFGDTDVAKAMAEVQESKIDEAGSVVIAHTIIPAIESFLKGLSGAAGYFQVVEEDLKDFEGKAETGEKDPSKLYFSLMKHDAQDIQSLCDDFLAVLPDVQTDFAALPQKDTDTNYVDTWLKNKEEEIKANAEKQLLEVFKQVFKQLAP